MIEFSYFFFYLCLIIALQSIIGVGVLVLGTPFLLILEYNMIEVFFILLPISIITSFSNLIIMKNLNKKKRISSKNELKKFYIICIPSIILGLLILKNFKNQIDFKIFVSIIIILSIFLVTFKNKIKFRINFFRKSILFLVGIIHGLTNSGGTLMSLIISNDYDKDSARFNITLFYLVLATIQYLITIVIFYNEFYFIKNVNFVWITIVGIIFGNIINRYADEKRYKFLINILALISSIFLLSK